MFDWRPEKAAENLRKHGVSFAAVERFEWPTAAIRIDDDLDYGEERMVATGFIGPSIHVLVYTERSETIRVISLRRATRQEIRTYEESF